LSEIPEGKHLLRLGNRPSGLDNLHQLSPKPLKSLVQNCSHPRKWVIAGSSITRTKKDNLIPVANRPMITMPSVGGTQMSANQVVLYFDKQEDALLFTLAAGSVMSAEEPTHRSAAEVKVAQEIRKASRITAEAF
jgi:hypothetical protein